MTTKRKRPATKPPAVPTLDRIQAVREKSQAIGEFLDWLRNEKKVELCRYQTYGGGGEGHDAGSYDDGWFPTSDTINSLLHEYFEIDPEAEERERRALLEHVRAQNARSGG